MVKKIIKIYFILLVIGLGLTIFVIYGYAPSLKVYFLDIGQGDSALIKTPSNQYILIDGGPDNAVVYKLGKYLPFYDRTIDLIILTHPDSDHLVGLNEIMKRYRVNNVMLSGVIDDHIAYQNFLAMINQKNINYLDAGQIRTVNLGLNLNLEIIHPVISFFGQPMGDDNDWSIVNRLIYGDSCVLFMADAPKTIEHQILERDEKVSCAILKIGHHGSNSSSSLEFLRAVNPQLVVISVGENRFGHPSIQVLDRLKQLGIRFLTTKEQGDIIVTLEKSKFVLE